MHDTINVFVRRFRWTSIHWGCFKLNYSPAYTIKKIILGRGIPMNFPELRRGFQIQHAQVTGITVHPWIISVGNVDYDPWTCEMILGTAYQYIYTLSTVCWENKLTSCEASGCGAEQIGLPSNVSIFSDEHRHKNSTCAMSLTLFLHRAELFWY